jgi:tetratricopeptide (TPR) repeat protein
MPQNADAHYNKGLALVAAGRFKEALSAFEKVLEIDPGNAPAAYSINLTRNRFEGTV